MAAGIPAARVAVDSLGVSTEATVADTVPFFGRVGWRRIIVVSQFYHLPRIKLAYQRAGWDVLTVPADGAAPPDARPGRRTAADGQRAVSLTSTRRAPATDHPVGPASATNALIHMKHAL